MRRAGWSGRLKRLPPPEPKPDGLEKLALRYVNGDLDLIDYLIAVDCYPSSAPEPPKPKKRVCDRCDIVRDGLGYAERICNGGCMDNDSDWLRPQTEEERLQGAAEDLAQEQRLVWAQIRELEVRQHGHFSSDLKRYERGKIGELRRLARKLHDEHELLRAGSKEEEVDNYLVAMHNL